MFRALKLLPQAYVTSKEQESEPEFRLVFKPSLTHLCTHRQYNLLWPDLCRERFRDLFAFGCLVPDSRPVRGYCRAEIKAFVQVSTIQSKIAICSSANDGTARVPDLQCVQDSEPTMPSRDFLHIAVTALIYVKRSLTKLIDKLVPSPLNLFSIFITDFSRSILSYSVF